jgi:hypothetical protein
MSEDSKVGHDAICDRTGRTFSTGHVEVVQRYADCSVFKCPCCGGTHDDRRAWGGGDNRRMGYSLIRQDVGWWNA